MAQNVLWIFGFHENSGYAQNSRAFIKALNRHDLNVKFLKDKKVHKYPEQEDMEKFEAQEDFKPDLVIQNVIPSCFSKIADKPNILMTFAETNRVSPHWAQKCNEADEIFTQSYFSKAAFVFSGVTRHISVAHTPTDIERIKEVVSSPDNTYKKDQCFTYFANGEWTPRKGFDILINAFYKTFHYCDFARLLIKTCSMNGFETTETMVNMINMAKKVYPQARCKITLINDITSIEEVWRLYRLADAFVLPSRGEAGGVPYMEAMALGIPVVCPSKGGQIDYINDDIAFTAKSKMVRAHRIPHNPFYDESMLWVETDTDDFGYQMMNVACDYRIEKYEIGQKRFEKEFGFDGFRIKNLAKYIKEKF